MVQDNTTSKGKKMKKGIVFVVAATFMAVTGCLNDMRTVNEDLVWAVLNFSGNSRAIFVG